MGFFNEIFIPYVLHPIFTKKRARHCFTVDKLGLVNLNYMYSYKP